MREALPLEPGRYHSRPCAKGERHAPLCPVIPGERSGSSTASGTAFEALPEARGADPHPGCWKSHGSRDRRAFYPSCAARGAGGEARAPCAQGNTGPELRSKLKSLSGLFRCRNLCVLATEKGQLAAYSLLCRGLRACFRCPLKRERLLGCASLAAEIHAALRVSCGKHAVEGGEKKRNFCLTKLPERLNVPVTNPPARIVGFAEFLQDTGSLPDRMFFLSRKISHVCRIFLYLLFARKRGYRENFSLYFSGI